MCVDYDITKWAIPPRQNALNIPHNGNFENSIFEFHPKPHIIDALFRTELVVARFEA